MLLRFFCCGNRNQAKVKVAPNTSVASTNNANNAATMSSAAGTLPKRVSFQEDPVQSVRIISPRLDPALTDTSNSTSQPPTPSEQKKGLSIKIPPNPKNIMVSVFLPFPANNLPEKPNFHQVKERLIKTYNDRKLQKKAGDQVETLTIPSCFTKQNFLDTKEYKEILRSTIAQKIYSSFNEHSLARKCVFQYVEFSIPAEEAIKDNVHVNVKDIVSIRTLGGHKIYDQDQQVTGSYLLANNFPPNKTLELEDSRIKMEKDGDSDLRPLQIY